MARFGRSGWLIGRSFGDLGDLLGGSWSPLGPLGALLGPLGRVLGASWLALESIQQTFGGYLEVILELETRL